MSDRRHNLRRRAILGLKTSMRRRPDGRENGRGRVYGIDLVMTLPHCFCTGASSLPETSGNISTPTQLVATLLHQKMR